MQIRQKWIKILVNTIHPVIYNLAHNTLKEKMPLKQHREATDREYCTYLEAVGRTLCGAGPWFNASNLESQELEQRDYYLNLTIQGLKNAVDTQSADFLFTKKEDSYLPQILVDTAFLALGLIRSKENLWDALDEATQRKLIYHFKETRKIQPGFNNWLLFSSMVEAFFYVVGEDYDMMRIDFGIKQMEQWYIGDGQYSDGKEFHADYYNSFVMQPFLVEILKQVQNNYKDIDVHGENVLRRAQRYAQIQEMSINADGTFPAIGRSITYRCGAFHHLAHMALFKQLPTEISEAQVRGALTAVITKSLQAPNTFDDQGWLNIGLYGNQPDLGEVYISIGSLYLCTFAFLPLGLEPNDMFWTAPDQPFTSQKIWNGINIPADHALYLS